MGKEVLIAEPDLLVQYLRQGKTDLSRVTYLVIDDIDEAIEEETLDPIREIRSQVRPDCQTIITTDVNDITARKDVVSLAHEMCQSGKPIQIWIEKENPFDIHRLPQEDLNESDEERLGDRATD